MDRIQKDTLISRILSGIFIYRDSSRMLFVYPPDRLTKQLSYEYYNEILSSVTFEDWLSIEDAQQFLLKNDILPSDAEAMITKAQNDIEELKLKAFENWMLTSKVKMFKQGIKQLENKVSVLYSAKHSLDHLTREGFAELCRMNYLILNSIKDKDGNRVNIEDDAILIEKIFGTLAKNFVPVATMRLLGRTDPWRSVWNAAGGVNPFGTNPIDWTEDQKTLVLYTQMYDNCYKHTECPEENVLEDDDLLDGWMIHQRRKAKEERKKNNTVEMGDAEHFVMAQGKTQEEIDARRREIDKMNDLKAREIRKQRDQALKNKGRLKESQLPDVQMELQRQANEMYVNKMRGK